MVLFCRLDVSWLCLGVWYVRKAYICHVMTLSMYAIFKYMRVCVCACAKPQLYTYLTAFNRVDESFIMEHSKSVSSQHLGIHSQLFAVILLFERTPDALSHTFNAHCCSVHKLSHKWYLLPIKCNHLTKLSLGVFSTDLYALCSIIFFSFFAQHDTLDSAPTSPVFSLLSSRWIVWKEKCVFAMKNGFYDWNKLFSYFYYSIQIFRWMYDVCELRLWLCAC